MRARERSKESGALRSVTSTAYERADRPCIIVAHDWAAARTSYAAYLKHLRPAYDVRAVLPEELDAALAETPAVIVVSGYLSDAISTRARGWVVLSDENPHDAIVGAGPYRRRLPTPDFEQVVVAIDDLVTRLATGVAHAQDQVREAFDPPSGLVVTSG
jgi:hypothetical protein